MDYRNVIFSQGIVCLNTNNNAYCVVIDGARGTPADRCSLVLEIGGELGFMLHTPPNRALVPTGEVRSLEALAKVLKKYVCGCESQED